jgi:putative hydrolase
MPDTPNPDTPTPDDLPPDPFGDGDPFDTADTGATPARPSSPQEPIFVGLDALGGLLGPMMGDLTKLFAQQRQSGWEQTRQFAALRAAGDNEHSAPTAGSPTTGSPTAASSTGQAVAPLDRIRLEELVAIVEPHVATTTGLDTSSSKGVRVNAVSRTQWATDFLDQHRLVLEPALTSPTKPSDSSDLTGAADPQAAMIANMMNLLGPSMMAMQLGAMAGQLSHRYLASGDLPMPRPEGDKLTFIPSNIQRFADAWSLPIDSLRIRVAIDELVLHSVTRSPHLTKTLQRLMAEHVAGFRIDGTAIMDRFADMASFDPTTDPSDPSLQNQMQNQMEALSAFGAIQRTPAQQHAAQQLQRLTALIRGYVDHVGGVISTQLLGGDRRIGEALRRRSFESDEATNMLASIVGTELNKEQQERGAAFIKGVFERLDNDGPASLNKLWVSEANLPTAAELDAPGLWLARLEFTT